LHPATNGRPLLLRGVNVAEKSYRTITQEFLHDLRETWKVHGKAALEKVATERPDLLVQIVAKLAQVQRIEVGECGDFHAAMSRAELLERVGERFGEQGRAMFERFVAQLDRLGEQQERQTHA
jgi:hypothetical protein